jgi:indolepyruvate ferredoxin oxidoreductase alpha subunit
MGWIETLTSGKAYLLMGNEAMARGALEAGVSLAAGYPGNPSSEIIENLAASTQYPVYAEWSVNEKVALEAAAAASFAGLRSLATMKQNGINVALDFLTNLTLSGTKGGMLLISCDDPSGISSTNEEDSRFAAKLSDIPLLEPSFSQEAKDMIQYAFALSEAIANPVMIRSVSRVSHTRGKVTAGELKIPGEKPHFDRSRPFVTFPVVKRHQELHRKLAQAGEWFEEAPFNQFIGREGAKTLVVATGAAFFYALEAIELLGLEEQVGLIKLGTTFPFPRLKLARWLGPARKILFLEEVDPFVETEVKAWAAQEGAVLKLEPKEFFGKMNGVVPAVGELNPDLVVQALEAVSGQKRDRPAPRAPLPVTLPPREVGFCAGCPHRASYFAVKTALTWDDRDGFVSGDIGCYTMGAFDTGFNQVKSVHAMGSGLGLANGYGQLARFGFVQPVITVCGDSTFFHAGIPALVNARYNQAKILLLIMDNAATAMTGFQPHPGTGVTAAGTTVSPVPVEAIAQALNFPVWVADPYDISKTARLIFDRLEEDQSAVIILRRKCALVAAKEGGFPYKVSVVEERCRGEACGCDRFCNRVFKCPGLIWDPEKGVARIDEVICVGCGVCAQICPQGAIECR